jgi:hypothetical protein
MFYAIRASEQMCQLLHHFREVHHSYYTYAVTKRAESGNAGYFGLNNLLGIAKKHYDPQISRDYSNNTPTNCYRSNAARQTNYPH